jgi:AcrR family transcriptional regulator
VNIGRTPRKRVPKQHAVNPRVRRSKEGLRSSLQKLLRRKSFEQISIRDIAADSCVGYTTFFRHYATKEALLEDLARSEIDRLLEITTPLFDPGNTQLSSLALCRYVDERWPLWTALLTGGAAAAMRESLIRGGHAIASGYPQRVSWLPEDLGSLIGATVIVETLVWWLRQKKPMAAEKMAEILNKIVIYPISHE